MWMEIFQFSPFCPHTKNSECQLIACAKLKIVSRKSHMVNFQGCVNHVRIIAVRMFFIVSWTAAYLSRSKTLYVSNLMYLCYSESNNKLLASHLCSNDLIIISLLSQMAFSRPSALRKFLERRSNSRSRLVSGEPLRKSLRTFFRSAAPVIAPAFGAPLR